MPVLRPCSEAEVIAAFLVGELDSPRFGPQIRALLANDGRDTSIVERPSLTDERANAYRARLLDGYRAWLCREGLFLGFPEEVEWCRAALTADEVLDILFINWDWWLTISGGTRRPREAARLIRAGEVPGESTDGWEPIAARLGEGTARELIVVMAPDRSRVVAVEGHARLTAYALYPEYLPDSVEVLLGVSDEIAEWCLY
jgi:hypothetical protein